MKVARVGPIGSHFPYKISGLRSDARSRTPFAYCAKVVLAMTAAFYFFNGNRSLSNLITSDQPKH